MGEGLGPATRELFFFDIAAAEAEASKLTPEPVRSPSDNLLRVTAAYTVRYKGQKRHIHTHVASERSLPLSKLGP